MVMFLHVDSWRKEKRGERREGKGRKGIGGEEKRMKERGEERKLEARPAVDVWRYSETNTHKDAWHG